MSATVFRSKAHATKHRIMVPERSDARSGCGVVIKTVDKDKWITISSIAVPLTTWLAMAAEVAEASVLTGMLDLVSGRSCVENRSQCIDEKIKYRWTDKMIKDEKRPEKNNHKRVSSTCGCVLPHGSSLSACETWWHASFTACVRRS